MLNVLEKHKYRKVSNTILLCFTLSHLYVLQHIPSFEDALHPHSVTTSSHHPAVISPSDHLSLSAHTDEECLANNNHLKVDASSAECVSKTTYMTACFHVCVNTCVQLPIPEVNEERCWEMEGSEQTPPGQTAGSRTRSNSTSGYTAVSKWWRLNRLIQIPPNIYMEKTPGRPLTFNTGPLIHPALFNSQGRSMTLARNKTSSNIWGSIVLVRAAHVKSFHWSHGSLRRVQSWCLLSVIGFKGISNIFTSSYMMM